MTQNLLEKLWQQHQFKPNANQAEAIHHIEGPLYLPAGPGSGKTRVLLWRTVNLIVCHNVAPNEIFLSTFTEKAARQLREGLRALLGSASNYTGVQYDLGAMYVGTVHSLCQRIPTDRRMLLGRQRGKAPVLMDALSQYFYLSKHHYWQGLLQQAQFGDDFLAAYERINSYFENRRSRQSRHQAVQNCISLFNRLSEECFEPDTSHIAQIDETLHGLLKMYAAYVQLLKTDSNISLADFSLIQQEALRLITQSPQAGKVFKHIIIDEYQDTNTVQERIFFGLAQGHKNLCVVGDDDQALYRFRGATVENFVQFPPRCQQQLGITPHKIPLSRNYRSRYQIVNFYSRFMEQMDWQDEQVRHQTYRVNKNIEAARQDFNVSVLVNTNTKPEDACSEIARFVRRLLDEGVVEDPNQIAFLFPSLKSKAVERMIRALENESLQVYAPRASTFLEVPEASAMFGLMMQVFGRQPVEGHGNDADNFNAWQEQAETIAQNLMQADANLANYVKDCRKEIEQAIKDYQALKTVTDNHQWPLESAYKPEQMRAKLSAARGLSSSAQTYLDSSNVNKAIENKIKFGKGPTLGYILTTATSLDWHILDLFYRLCGFEHFINMFDTAEDGSDEGPICNLSLISQYLARFNDEFNNLITAPALADKAFQRTFFISFLYSLFRLGESEYEDANDPFPRGRIPFLTIHQSKGLEFPVVVLGSLDKRNTDAQPVEKMVRQLLPRTSNEPLDKVGKFDAMRQFYVALSRAQQLLVVTRFTGQGQQTFAPFKSLLEDLPKLSTVDLSQVPKTKLHQDKMPETYSYTGDYLFYQKCARQYMIFRKFGFASSTTQTMTFGNLVHRTIEDLHQYLIAQRQNAQDTALA
ncbi:MAG: ATP-dependent helicase [Anaerolineae bacterium]|nr:ATP-dependent helicase [Anaerolineae bacterium]